MEKRTPRGNRLGGGASRPADYASKVVGVPVRVRSRQGDDLGICHVPPPVEIGDVLELGRGPLFPFRVVDLVETGPYSPLAALVKVSPAPMLVY